MTVSPPVDPPLNTDSILKAALDGRPPTVKEGAHLLSLSKAGEREALRETAEQLRERHTGNQISFNVDVPIFFSNLCETKASVHDFPDRWDHPNARVLSIDEILEQVERGKSQRATAVTLTGRYWSLLRVPGLENPDILKTYGKLVETVRGYAPELSIQGFSPDEIAFLSIVSARSHCYVLEMLADMGLRGMNAFGVEILDSAVRKRISPKLLSAKDWLNLAVLARKLGIKVSLGMGFGHFETPVQRAEHLERIRQFVRLMRRDGSEAPLPFVLMATPDSTRLRQSGATVLSRAERLQIVAVTRLYLGEDIPWIQTYWLPDAEPGAMASHRREQWEEVQEGLLWGANHAGSGATATYPAFVLGRTDLPEPGREHFQTLIEGVSRPVREWGTPSTTGEG